MLPEMCIVCPSHNMARHLEGFNDQKFGQIGNWYSEPDRILFLGFLL